MLKSPPPVLREMIFRAGLLLIPPEEHNSCTISNLYDCDTTSFFEPDPLKVKTVVRVAAIALAATIAEMFAAVALNIL